MFSFFWVWLHDTSEWFFENFNSRVVQQYYVDNYVPLSVPAPEWVNGCPLDQIVCCPSYVEMNEQCFCKYTIFLHILWFLAIIYLTAVAMSTKHQKQTCQIFRGCNKQNHRALFKLLWAIQTKSSVKSLQHWQDYIVEEHVMYTAEI